MRVPADVRNALRSLLWAQADKLGWSKLSWVEKTNWYDIWGRDPEVGGKLSDYLDQREVRVYIKDTLMKAYARSKSSDASVVLRALGLDKETESIRTYERPHGKLFKNGAMIAWGKASDWKSILMAVFERSYVTQNACPHGVVLQSALGRFSEEKVRRMIEDAADRLGIERVVWLG